MFRIKVFFFVIELALLGLQGAAPGFPFVELVGEAVGVIPAQRSPRLS